MSAATVLALASRLAAIAEAEGVQPFSMSVTAGENYESITFLMRDDDLAPALAAALGLSRHSTYQIEAQPGMSREVFKTFVDDVEVSTHRVLATAELEGVTT